MRKNTVGISAIAQSPPLNLVKMKDTFLTLVVVFLFGCSNNNSEMNKIQSAYLDDQVTISMDQLRNLVEETGNSPVGVSLLYHATELVEKYDSILILIENQKIDILEYKIKKYLNFAQNNPDSIKLATALLLNSIQHINQSNALEFENNFKLFTIEIIDKYRDHYFSYFHIYDYSEPILIPNQSKIIIGEPYSADIIISASNVAISPSVEIDFLDDDHGYFAIPVTSDGRAHLKIRKLKKDKTKINIRLTQYNNGIKRQIESTKEIIAE